MRPSLTDCLWLQKFIPTHYHSAKGQSTFVLDSFPWLTEILDGALFYYLGSCDAAALPDFAAQIAQFDAKLAAASKQLHVTSPGEQRFSRIAAICPSLVPFLTSDIGWSR